MIEIRSLSKFYGAQKVLREMDLKIKRGTVAGIIGPNACGKTTLIKCILGLCIPTAGEIWIDGLRSDRRGEFRRKIGYMPQTPTFPGNLCLRELLDMLEKLRHQNAVSREELVDYFDLGTILSRSLDQLSGGTRQKVAAVIAFMFNAPIVILDEPTVGLDPMASVLFKNLVLKRAAEGTTIVFISHIMAEIERMADEIAFIDEGKIAFAGSVADLLKQAGGAAHPSVCGESQLERAVVRLFETYRKPNQ